MLIAFTANTTGSSFNFPLTIAGQTVTITQAVEPPLGFFALTPCRIADTRSGSGFSGAFGEPYLTGGSTRSFPIPTSTCSVPGTAQAYSFNITVIPHGALGYLTAWPTGSAVPIAATLNSPEGSIVGNAAIVPAGTDGAISLYASGDTDVVIDINGYFAAPGGQAQAFYPLAPCRVADTRAMASPGLLVLHPWWPPRRVHLRYRAPATSLLPRKLIRSDDRGAAGGGGIPDRLACRTISSDCSHIERPQWRRGGE